MSVPRPSVVIGSLWIIISVICGVTPSVLLAEGGNQSTSGENDNSAVNQPQDEPVKEDFNQDALERLSKLFGISKIPENFHHRTPPDYMLELYSTVAYDDGITKQSVPYDADVVRAIPDKALHQQILYHFNVSYIDPAHTILQAEFHLYKISPQQTDSRQEGDNRPTAKRGHGHVLQLRLYQILDPNRIEDKSAQRLLHQRRVSTYERGWEVFKVKDTVEEWVSQGQTNHGFLIETSSINGEADDLLIRFAQKSEHHDSKQPLLVVFTEEMKAQMEEEQSIVDDEEPSPPVPVEEEDIVETVNQNKTTVLSHVSNSTKSPIPAVANSTTASSKSSTTNESLTTDISSLRRKYIAFLNEKHRAEHGTFPNIQTFSVMSPEQHQQLLLRGQLTSGHSASAGEDGGTKKRRRKRRAEGDYGHQRHQRKRSKKVCSLHALYVDFDKIGWSGWIISPKGYDAFHCKGSCPFPLGQNQQPTNHATVQSIVHALGAGREVGTPCCVPNKLFSISLLYFDDQENVILKQYDDMVATSCGCH